MQPPVPVPQGAMSSSASFSFSPNPQLVQNAQNQPSKSDTPATGTQTATVSSMSTVSQPGQLPVHNSSDFTMNASTTPSFAPITSWMPATPSFPMSSGSSGTPGAPAHPGLVPSIQMITASAAAADSPSPAVPGHSAPISLNPAVQQQAYPPYTSMPPMVSSTHGFWMQHPPMGGFPRPPFVPYPSIYPGPFPSTSHGMLHPAPSSDSQPPGVRLLGMSPFAPSIAALANQPLAIQTGLPQGIDNRKLVHDVGTKAETAFSEQSDVWTAHKTDTGVVYYYNALTGESTYEKPAGFRGEPDQVTVQPTPISVEQLAGTGWALVTTNDGKKYYYNSKTKISSWQIPSEVTELRKKQDGEVLKEHAAPVSTTDIVAEKGSTPVSLSAPAVNTGGRDAMPLRMSVVPSSSSALDLIKKKLQDSGVPSSSTVPVTPVTAANDLNGSKAVDVKGLQSGNNKDKLKDNNGDGNISESSSDSEDADTGPSKEECIMQFKEMLKELGVAPFSKWERELPKIVFDPRFKAIPSHSARRSLFEHYVKTRAEEERREKRAAQKAAIEGFKKLLGEASEDIDHNTNYQSFKRKWGSDPRFEALDRKDRELLLNERVFLLKRAAEDKTRAIRAAAASSFKAMIKEKGDINVNSRWSRVKESLRNDPRYKSVKHEDREVLFNDYISELKAVDERAERKEKVRKEEEDKLKERERELRKRKEREEQEMKRVRLKVRRKEAVSSFQALLVETIKHPQASWTESKPKLEKDPQGRAANPDLDSSDMEKLFREHIKMLFERFSNDFRALLSEVITQDAAAQHTEGGKTVLNSWSTAKRLLKPDPRYNKMPRKEREVLWRRHAEDMLRKQKSATDQEEEKHTDAKGRSSAGDFRRYSSGARNVHERR
ncbi:pre-mRNA-processing protein 40C-like [Hibiscus syriacus]|uniref:pre-mRNA-processing protein 40C-like n=1 Tax=Hibiscus syriacus TaxID=106335 RepID=UPI00192384B4|nr:pre-mRNA-processing protein 40C-like [Hibiscus syriacus]XP_039054775.1 pre-mRNA-processing protein 40C-like [Hibiscus syriacus]